MAFSLKARKNAALALRIKHYLGDDALKRWQRTKVIPAGLGAAETAAKAKGGKKGKGRKKGRLSKPEVRELKLARGVMKKYMSDSNKKNRGLTKKENAARETIKRLQSKKVGKTYKSPDLTPKGVKPIALGKPSGPKPIALGKPSGPKKAGLGKISKPKTLASPEIKTGKGGTVKVGHPNSPMGQLVLHKQPKGDWEVYSKVGGYQPGDKPGGKSLFVGTRKDGLRHIRKAIAGEPLEDFYPKGKKPPKSLLAKTFTFDEENELADLIQKSKVGGYQPGRYKKRHQPGHRIIDPDVLDRMREKALDSLASGDDLDVSDVKTLLNKLSTEDMRKAKKLLAKRVRFYGGEHPLNAQIK